MTDECNRTNDVDAQLLTSVSRQHSELGTKLGPLSSRLLALLLGMDTIDTGALVYFSVPMRRDRWFYGLKMNGR
jgi:hypothetical protein